MVWFGVEKARTQRLRCRVVGDVGWWESGALCNLGVYVRVSIMSSFCVCFVHSVCVCVSVCVCAFVFVCGGVRAWVCV